MLDIKGSSSQDISDFPSVMTPAVCKECGCRCDACGNVYLDLHQQIAELHSQLQKSGSYIGNVEEQLRETKLNADVELNKTKEELSRLRERYDRLLESHKKMQKINHDLEDKLLRMVGQFESEKISLQQELSAMMNRLVDARTLITHLDEENEKYRLDCNMAVQLLQCKPSNFVSHRLNTLPLDLQERVKQLMPREQIIAVENSAAQHEEQQQQRQIRIPIATFPPTAMVYSLHQNVKKESPPQNSNGDVNPQSGFVPSALIAKALSQTTPRRTIPRSYLCMTCKRDVHHLDNGCQVDLLTRGTRPVEITPLSSAYSDKSPGLSWIHSPPRSSHSLSDIQYSVSPGSQDGWPSHHSAQGGNSFDSYNQPKREKCLSTSSTETEL